MSKRKPKPNFRIGEQSKETQEERDAALLEILAKHYLSKQGA